MTRVNTQSRFIEMYSKCQKNSLSSIASSWDKGQAFKKESIVDKGTTQCIHYGELFTKYGPIIDKVLSTTNEEAIKVSKKGDILFPASDVTPNGLARCSAVMLDKVLLGGDIIVLRLSDGVVPEYISYAINMQKEQLIRRVTGSVVRHLSSKNLASVTIPVPSLGEQVMFVKIIRKADKSKFNGFKSRFIEQFSNADITRVPLSNLCSLFIDGDWIETKDQSDSGYRLVQTGNVGVCEYLDKEEHSRFVSEETFRRLNCTEIHSGDLLFSRLPEPIGRCCIIPKDFPKAITAVDCTITRLKDNCLPEYLMVYTTTTMYSDQIKKCITGTTRQRISRGNLAKIVVPLPNMKQQNEFVLFVHQADKSKYLS